MELNIVRKLIENRKIRWSVHAAARMQERGIRRSDVLNCLEHGKVIEDYPDDYPTPSCLVFGYTLSREVIHVVVGCDQEMVYIITVYRPDRENFEADLRTRKEH